MSQMVEENVGLDAVEVGLDAVEVALDAVETVAGHSSGAIAP